jgi:type IV pilus assembly protein PilF
VLKNCLTAFISLVISTALIFPGCAGMNKKNDENAREGDIHLKIGSNYLHKGNLELAHFELTKAARLTPKNPDVHFALGTVYLLQNEMDPAIEEFTKTIELDDGYADAYNNLGFAYLKLGKWDKAIESCSKALDQVQYETPERALTIMGWAYYKKGDPGRAVTLLNKALDIRPLQPDAENKLATIYLEQGRIDKSKTILVKLVKREPEFAAARLNLGIVYYKEKDVMAAGKEFRAVLDLVDPKSDEARLAKGYLDLIE